MNLIFSSVQVERLRREAKKLSRTSNLSHSQALDQLAAERGYDNWSLLTKHSHRSLLDAISFEAIPYEGGVPGVYLIRIAVKDQEHFSRAVAGTPWFELPAASQWMFRPATSPQHKFAPYLRLEPLTGIFVDGLWEAILSTNGVQDSAIERHVALTLQPVLDKLHMRAAMALEPWSGAPMRQRQYRLFYSRPQVGRGPELADMSFSTLDAAMSAQLPPGCVKIGIPGDDSWLYYQEPFGWQGPGIS